MTNDKLKIYGFEDCSIFCIDEEFLVEPDNHDVNHCRLPNYYFRKYGYYTSYYNYALCEEVEDNDLPDNSGILNGAISLFVHPSCKIPRTLLRSVYKLKDSPWDADVVVIPETAKPYIEKKCLLFYNEDAAKIFMMENAVSRQDGDFSHHLDKTFSDISPYTVDALYMAYTTANNAGTLNYHFKDLMDAVLIYVGPMSFFQKKYEVSYEIATNQLPKDKLIPEEKVIQALDSEDRDISLDNLINLHGMLKSSDDEMAAAGLKTLAMLNYTKCPNSVKYILRAAYPYNKAYSHTAVKFMVNYLKFEKNRLYRNFRDPYISKEDAELLKGLLETVGKDDKSFITYCSFVYRDINNEPQFRVRS